MRPVLASFLAFLWVAMAQGAFAGQLIVIDSTAPELVPGQVVDGSKLLDVAANLARHGRLRQGLWVDANRGPRRRRRLRRLVEGSSR